MPTNYSCLTGHKRARPSASAAASATTVPKRLADFAAPPVGLPKALPSEVAAILGPELTGHFDRLVECEERIDLAVERARSELQGALPPPPPDAAGAGMYPSLIGLNPRPVLRHLRIFIASHLQPTAPSDAGTPQCEWSLNFWAMLHAEPPAADAALGSSTPTSAPASAAGCRFTDAVALERYFSLVHVQVDSGPQQTVQQWKQPDAPLIPGTVAPTQFELKRTTDLPADGGAMTAKVTIRMRRTGGQGLSASARVRLSAQVAQLLCLPANVHIVYADLEEAFWLLIKERRLLETRRETEAEQLQRRKAQPDKVPMTDVVTCVRVGAPNARDLRTLLEIPHDKQLATISEMRHFLHRTIVYWEPPEMTHTIGDGDRVSCFDLIVADEEPLHAERAAALARLDVLTSQSAAPLAALDQQLASQLASLQQTARKVEWLDELLLRDEDEGKGEEDEDEEEKAEEGKGGAANATATSSADAADGTLGRRPRRSAEEFAQVLFESQLHATRHSLQPTMLRTPAIPPLLPTDAPPPTADGAERGFNAPWVGWAVKSYLGDRHVRRR